MRHNSVAGSEVRPYSKYVISKLRLNLSAYWAWLIVCSRYKNKLLVYFKDFRKIQVFFLEKSPKNIKKKKKSCLLSLIYVCVYIYVITACLVSLNQHIIDTSPFHARITDTQSIVSHCDRYYSVWQSIESVIRRVFFYYEIFKVIQYLAYLNESLLINSHMLKFNQIILYQSLILPTEVLHKSGCTQLKPENST